MVWHYFYFEFYLFQVFTVLNYPYGTTLEILKNLFRKLLILRIKNFVVPKNIVKNLCLAQLFQKDGLRNDHVFASHLYTVEVFDTTSGTI